ncbi:biotin/lipoyl-containing protein [Puniceicoccus vermicola]|uniref:Biotin/lipoyl-binding protein n=1 Tax=Puniceicoccus vermicola TaxID=388746 RepID=A0A7X1B199_9BACT|nr:biotin/lipoyl-containing protein [Puniceicoccus vermicola]MBC2603764.1 biotin/lipoyl-binding protein [Puniceicoccus vermicola]
MKKLRVTVDGKSYEVEVEILEEIGGASSAPAAARPARPAAAAAAAPAPAAAAPKPIAGDGEVPSPLSAVVVSVEVKPGDQVNEGDQLITLEAMKMNTLVTAPASGTVGEILVGAGDAVEEGQALLKLS